MTPHAALRAVAPSTGWSDELLQRVSFSGGADPILPTPFRIGAAGAAAIAASGLAAADLWEQRSGRPQDVAVDLRQATAALRSALYMRLGDGPVPDERSPIMGVYPTKGGRWAYIPAAALKAGRADIGDAAALGAAIGAARLSPARMAGMKHIQIHPRPV